MADLLAVWLSDQFSYGWSWYSVWAILLYSISDRVAVIREASLVEVVN